MKLLIVSHTPHYRLGESIVGWGATVREIDHLATLFDEVVHLAPLHLESPPASSMAYEASNLRFCPVKPAGGTSLLAKVGILVRLPAWSLAIRREMRRADVVHVRCPASISLLALLLLNLFRRPRPRWVKYAGNWRPDGAEAPAYRLQRWLLRRRGHRAVVTVNGSWAEQPAHIVPFHNPCLTSEEIEEGRQAARARTFEPPFRLAFIGALIPGKGADVALRVVKALEAEEPRIHLDIVGDGPLRGELETLVHELDLEGRVTFHGYLSRNRIPAVLEHAHILLHPSRSEGFPKVVAEAMAYGAVPIAGAVSSIPQLLEVAKAGVAIDPRDTRGFVRATSRFLHDEDRWLEAVENGMEAACQFTYDVFLDQVVELLESRFRIRVQSKHVSPVLTP